MALTETETPEGKNMLLLVEDELSMLDLLENALADAGFEVLTACNGSQAFAELDENPARFGSVITDINLGAGPDGWRSANTSACSFRICRFM